MGKGMKGLDIGIDLRLRCLQRELDRVAHSSNSTMTSSILHAAPQRYPTSTLRLNLEAEIDRLLREQVSERKYPLLHLGCGDALRRFVVQCYIAPTHRFSVFVWPSAGAAEREKECLPHRRF